MRRFVWVDGKAGRPSRRVHYRRIGHGPPLVLLHGSPGDAAMLAGEMAAASEHFTCIAFDTPGFGDSDPLVGDELCVADLADATADAMQALGLPSCPIYGTHTGAAIALELGVGRPECATGLVLEGVPVFTESEIDVLFRGYFAPMQTEALGGHFISTWMRFRDQFTWFPWASRSVERLNAIDRPEPAEIDLWVSMFYRSCKTYQAAYRAACTYGQGAYRAASALRLPAVFFTSDEDMLRPHLDRLPPLHQGQRIERLPYDPAVKHLAIVDFARSMPNGKPLESDAPASFVASGREDGERRQFFDIDGGQLLVRAYGNPRHPAVLILHDAPGTGLAHGELAAALADDFFVLLPDLPGNGESTAPAANRSVLDASVDALGALATTLDLRDITLVAIGCGAAVAARWAARRDSRVRDTVLCAVAAFDPASADLIAPAIDVTAEGAHWLRAWLMLRDGQIYAPWYDGRVAAQRRTQGNFDAQWLHDQTCALMASRESYHRLPREASRCDSRAELVAAGARPVELDAADHDSMLRSILARSIYSRTEST